MRNASEKLARLRATLHQSGIDAYIIPSTDPNLGENIPDHWRIIEWLTGFTGSYATIVITDSFAGLWTDSRYFIQAEKQLAGTGFELIKPEINQENDYSEFLAERIGKGSKIGLDGRIFSVSRFRNLEKKLYGKDIEFNLNCDLISELWTDRPALPDAPAFDHAVEFCGKERKRKIAEVRNQLKNRKIDYHLIMSADDIMWLLNIRGRDVKFVPLLVCFALIGPDQVLLFTHDEKIPVKLAEDFDKAGVVILPYEDVAKIVSAATENAKVLLNPEFTSVALFNSMNKNQDIIEDISIPSKLKAIKNKTEIGNLSRVMVRDSIALTKFFFWFENRTSDTRITENDLAFKLHELRSQQKHFLCESFESIIAFNAHSALPHYTPGEGNDSEITENGILLIDSGGQYMDGTTDITRTISVGIPTARQKRDFTLVLKGHINLAVSKFPSGTKGYQLDILARKYLWDEGMNYGHGTGHGVGFCLNVHEGPQSISPSANKIPFEAGMLTSNEPAIYREGEYGIRTENLILCYEEEETEFGQFLRFDTVSLCYIDKTLIDKSLLDKKEIDWLNSYHKEVYEKISPYLTREEQFWLREKTDPI
ncbi:MAG: aminopeptidase P family protein [Bacteroidota bacterium]|nr:aminopeptidase P family protein [Bacteroidota bacterium]